MNAVSRLGIVAMTAAIVMVITPTPAIARMTMRDVCKTEACEDAAKRLSESMDLTADPCEDFYAFCCNGWVTKHPPYLVDSNEGSVLMKANKKLEMQFLEVVSQIDLREEQSEVIKRAIANYRRCRRNAGRREKSWRWKISTNCRDKLFSFADGEVMRRIVVEKILPREAKFEGAKLLNRVKDNIASAFIENEWLDKQAKKVALDKLKNMTYELGYPMWILDDEELDDRFAVWDPKQGQESLSKFHFTKIGMTNAVFSRRRNKLTIYPAMLLPPFYESNRTQYLNYASFGTIIGHEIMHAFDVKGILFDSAGERNPWLNEKSDQAFQKRTRCLETQYKDFKTQSSYENINMSFWKQNQALSDAEGLKASYSAYMDWVRNHGEEPTLPGFENFGPSQLFFIQFASLWCHSGNLRSIHHEELNEKHRNWISVLNNEAFAESFGCKKNQKMNPMKKCRIWMP